MSSWQQIEGPRSPRPGEPGHDSNLKNNEDKGTHEKGESNIVEFVDMPQHTGALVSAVPLDCPLFEAVPPNYTFTEYAPFMSSTISIKLRNRDAVCI